MFPIRISTTRIRCLGIWVLRYADRTRPVSQHRIGLVIVIIRRWCTHLTHHYSHVIASYTSRRGCTPHESYSHAICYCLSFSVIIMDTQHSSLITNHVIHIISRRSFIHNSESVQEYISQDSLFWNTSTLHIFYFNKTYEFT